jgi:hypothetical protein
MSPRSEAVRVALILLLALPVGACVDYLNHRDTVTLGAGDAMHANAAIQTINPWPYSSREKYILYDGQYLENRINHPYWDLPATGGGGCVASCTTINNSSGGGQSAAAPTQ